LLTIWEGGASSSGPALYLATKDRYLRQFSHLCNW